MWLLAVNRISDVVCGASPVPVPDISRLLKANTTEAPDEMLMPVVDGNEVSPAMILLAPLMVRWLAALQLMLVVLPKMVTLLKDNSLQSSPPLLSRPVVHLHIL